MQSSATNLRRRKAEKVAKKETKKTETPETSNSPVENDALYYYFFQYGGLVLGATSCFGTVALYEQDDPYMVAKMVGFMGLAFLGLLLHEFRPYQRPV